MAFDLAYGLFWLKKLTAALILPPAGPLLLIALGLLLVKRRPRTGRAFAWSGLVLALLLSTPASVAWLLRGLEPAAVVDIAEARTAQAIVILGGGLRTHAPEFGGPTVNRLTLERLRYGARLARETGLPILVSGGIATGEHPEALAMRAALEHDFGLPVRWTESTSRDTRGNARYSADLLGKAGIRRILLVTHAAHMPRAAEEFRAAGLDVIPAPTAWQSGVTDDYRFGDFVPGPTAAYSGWYAAHEWLGRLAYRMSR